MAHLDTAYGLGFLLLALGLFLWLIVYLSTKIIPAIQSIPNPIKKPSSSNHDEIILAIQPGGKIAYVNQRALEVFQAEDIESLNLERIAAHIRPGDKFLSLCSAEGQSRLIFEGQIFEAVSFELPIQRKISVVLTMRQIDTSSGFSVSDDQITNQTLQTYTEVTQAIASSLNLETTLQATLESIETLLPADFMEIAIWDASSEMLIPYRFSGFPGAGRQLILAKERYLLGEGFAGHIAHTQKPLLISDISARSEFHTAIDRRSLPIQSYLGMPLCVGKEFIGSLGLGALVSEAFKEEDLELLKLFSGQAAIAIHNARLYRDEKRRVAELATLSKLTQAFGSLRDPATLFTRMVESIVPLFDVEVLGFILYNVHNNAIEGQEPFHGLPPQFIEIYQAAILPNSPAEHILLEQDVILSDNASDDLRWQQLGLEHLAKAASLRESVLVPLTSGGRLLGYLQASNHKDRSQNTFSQDELRLLTIIASHAAPIIDNATLIQRDRQRVDRAESMQRIAGLVSSSAPLNEIVETSLSELTQLFQAHKAAIFLMDQGHNQLSLYTASSFNSEYPVERDKLNALLIEDPQFPFTVTARKQPLLSEFLAEEQAIIPYYQKTMDLWNVKSAIIFPLVVRSEGIGELWLGSETMNFFSHNDQQLLTTIAGQLAGVVDQTNLVSQTDEGLRRRVQHLTILTRISRELSSSLDFDYLFNLVYEEAIQITNADQGAIYLFDLQNNSTEELKIRYTIGSSIPQKLSPLEQKALNNAEPVCLPVIENDQAELLRISPNIQSALIVPIVYQLNPAGLILLYSEKPNWFDESAVEVAQSLATQAAITLGNALQYENEMRRGELLNREVETIARLFQVSQSLRQNRSLEEKLESIALAINEATPFQVIIISVYNPQEDNMQRVCAAGMPTQAWEFIKKRPQPWRRIRKILQEEYRLGNTYYIPADKIPVMPEDVHIDAELPLAGQETLSTWNPKDVFIVPLYDMEQKPLGVISVDIPLDERRPDRPTLEALELFGSLAALIIEDHNHISAMGKEIVEKQKESELLQKSARDSQEHLPGLLHKDLEQIITIQALNRQIKLSEASLEMAELTSLQPDIPSALRTLAIEILTRFDWEIALIAEKTTAGLKLLDTIGRIPDQVNPEALFGQRNPLAQSLQDNQVVLVSNLDDEQVWQDVPLLNALNAKSFISLPLVVEDDHTTGILATYHKPLPPFSEEEQRTYDQLTRQVSVGLQNLNLLTNTRRHLQEVNLLLEFSRSLGKFDPDRILLSLLESLSQTIPMHAAWVGLISNDGNQLIPQQAIGYPKNDNLLAIRYSLQPISIEDDSFDENEGAPLTLPARVFLSGKTKRIDEVSFAEDYRLPYDDLLLYKEGLGEQVPLSSLCVPLRLGEEMLGVIVIDNFTTTSAFSKDDEALVMTLGQQTTLALENARLYLDAEQRTVQLQSLTQTASVMTASLQSEELIVQLLDQLKAIIPFDTATLWLREDDHLTIAAARGFEDQEERVGISVEVEDSVLFIKMAETGNPILSNNIIKDDRFSALKNPDYLSWLGIPLFSKSELIGAIALEKREEYAYSQDHIQIVSAFASQAAIALENARLYEESLMRAVELDLRSQRMALLNKFSSELSSSLDVNHILKLTIQQLKSALDASRVAVVISENQEDYFLQVEIPDDHTNLPLQLPDIPLFKHLSQSMSVLNVLDIHSKPEFSPLMELYFEPRNTHSLLIVPLASGVWIFGWLWIQTDAPYHFNAAEIELARTISNQASIAIQNAYLFAETNALKEDLEKRVEDRTAELQSEHQNSKTLLRIITELSVGLDASRFINHVLSILNEAVGAEESIILQSEAGSQIYRSGSNLAGLEEDERLAENVDAPIHQITREVIRSQETITINDITTNERWYDPQKNQQPSYRSILIEPLILDNESIGALVLLNSQPSVFLKGQYGLIEGSARQFSIAINNSDLFKLARNQAENLSIMLRNQQTILEAIADGVLVTNANNQISVFNQSAERILGLTTSDIMGKSLEQFTGVFGRAASEWMQTIRTWSEDPFTYSPEETYAERLELEDGRIVSVHLAPVIWGLEFLGTVSIFRDITHEVQIDRLKSEFVANVSHELRTPMTSIKGYVEILMMGAGGDLNPQQQHFLQVVNNNTDRLIILVNDLLDISRIDAGRVILSIEPLDLAETTEEVIQDIIRRSDDDSKPINFELDASADLPQVKGDAVRVRQILSNLIVNAYYYTPANGHVNVHIHSDGYEVQVDVKDDGIGINPKDQARIFERFYRGEDPLVLATAGTGLGLAICKTLVKMHHGRIWFNSSGIRNEGSTFSFTLPVYQED